MKIETFSKGDKNITKNDLYRYEIDITKMKFDKIKYVKLNDIFPIDFKLGGNKISIEIKDDLTKRAFDLHINNDTFYMITLFYL